LVMAFAAKAAHKHHELGLAAAHHQAGVDVQDAH